MNEKDILLEIYKRILKSSFWQFCLYMAKDFFLGRKHPLEEIAHILQEAYEKGLKVAISTPPRTAKSTIINYYIAWLLLKDKNNHILRASYSQTLSSELNAGVRDIINSPKYKALLDEDYVFTEDTKIKLRIKGTHRANLYASSIGGSLTGFGGNIAILDDPYKDHLEALSETVNNKTITWHSSAFLSRLDTEKQTEVIICTRWRTDELIDKLEKEDYFDIVYKVKALTDEDKSFNENVISTEKLLERKKIMHPAIFNSMYQQEPMESYENIIELHDIKYIDNYEASNYSFRLAVFDIADKGGDHTAGVILDYYKDTDEVVVLDVISRQNDLTELKPVMRDLVLHYEPTYTFIEDNSQSASIREFITSLKNEHDGNIKAFHTSKNKENKILLNVGEIKQFKYVKTQDKEFNTFIREVCKYSFVVKNKRDDEIDVLAMANEFKNRIKRGN